MRAVVRSNLALLNFSFPIPKEGQDNKVHGVVSLDRGRICSNVQTCDAYAQVGCSSLAGLCRFGILYWSKKEKQPCTVESWHPVRKTRVQSASATCVMWASWLIRALLSLNCFNALWTTLWNHKLLRRCKLALLEKVHQDLSALMEREVQ